MQEARGFNSRLRATGMEAIVGLLACSGMRVGEALALDRCDVDLGAGLITVRRAKLDKERLVPLHQSTVDALGVYGDERDRLSPSRQRTLDDPKDNLLAFSVFPERPGARSRVPTTKNDSSRIPRAGPTWSGSSLGRSSILPLHGAVDMEPTDEWTEFRRYMEPTSSTSVDHAVAALPSADPPELELPETAMAEAPPGSRSGRVHHSR